MQFPTGFTYRNLHGFARFPCDSTALFGGHHCACSVYFWRIFLRAANKHDFAVVRHLPTSLLSAAGFVIECYGFSEVYALTCRVQNIHR